MRWRLGEDDLRRRQSPAFYGMGYFMDRGIYHIVIAGHHLIELYNQMV